MCVACQTEVTGRRALPVKEDRIIRTLRAVKKALGIAQNNQLFVCESCMPKHSERRRSFEKTLLFASVLAGIMLVLLILVPMLSGRFEAWAIVSGIIVACFVVLVPIIFKYVPAVAGISSVPPTKEVRWVQPIQPAPRGPPSSPEPPVSQQPAYKSAPPAPVKEEKAKEKSTKKARKK